MKIGVTNMSNETSPKRHTHTDFIVIDTHRCQACWACVGNCPKQVINKVQILGHKHAHIRAKENCCGCLKCVRVCPQAAIKPRERSDEKTAVHLLA